MDHLRSTVVDIEDEKSDLAVTVVTVAVGCLSALTRMFLGCYEQYLYQAWQENCENSTTLRQMEQFEKTTAIIFLMIHHHHWW